MIDTIKMKIPYSDDLARALQSKRLNYWEKGTTDGAILPIRIVNTELVLGSFDRNINIRLNVPFHEIFVELSLPKYVFGHNVFLLSSYEALVGIRSLYNDLCKYFDYELPPLSSWELYRLDICYAWKLENEDDAKRVISLLSTIDYPRKQKLTRDTGVLFIGEKYSFKFYLKHSEFYKHDYKFLASSKKFTDMAYRLYDISEGVLRVEATLRHQYVKLHFGSDIISVLSDFGKLQCLLCEFLTKLLKYENREFMSKYEVLKLLKSRYPKKVAYRLWSFYRDYYSPDFKDHLEDCYSRITIYKNLRALRDAGVGLSVDGLTCSFNLSIPSEYAVNSVDLTPEGVNPQEGLQ